MSGRIAALVLLAAAMAPQARAEEPVRSAWADPDSPWVMREPMPVPLVFLESPAPFRPPYWLPTWGQALQLHDAAVTLGLHAADALTFGIDLNTRERELPAQLAERALKLSPFALVAIVALGFPSVVPFGSPWLRRQATLGALAANGLIGTTANSPSCSGPSCGLTDDQIAAVHDRRVEDWVRVEEAPWELQYEKITRSERTAFFYNRNPDTYWAYTLLQFIELAVPAHEADEGPAWTWDLHRPWLGYLDRPEHEGVRRVEMGDLNDEERQYLQQVHALDALNFVDGFLVAGWSKGLPLPSPFGGQLRANGALRHHRTTSGDLFALSLLARQDPVKAEASLELYRSRWLVLPGLTLRLHRYPVRLAGLPVLASVTASGWLQPQDQSFLAFTATPGGSLRLSTAIPLNEFLEGFLEVRAKTPGWIAGDPDLNAGVQAGIGLSLLLDYARTPSLPERPPLPSPASPASSESSGIHRSDS